jgi:hypothetical protein
VEDLPLLELIAATGAVGTAAMGIVELLKSSRLGELGFGTLARVLGREPLESVATAYGPDTLTLLRGMYRSSRGEGELRRTLRQGLRIGLTPESAPALAARVGVVDADALADIARAIHSGRALEEAEQAMLGRYELAVDARIDAALALAESAYVRGMRLTASLVALCLAFGGAWLLPGSGAPSDPKWVLALLVGITAVPLAPIAKDVATGLREATRALGATRRRGTA